MHTPLGKKQTSQKSLQSNSLSSIIAAKEERKSSSPNHEVERKIIGTERRDGAKSARIFRLRDSTGGSRIVKMANLKKIRKHQKSVSKTRKQKLSSSINNPYLL